jgi:hypothetical protein
MFRTGSWRASPQFGGGSPHGEVLGRTIGIIGYGRIGRERAHDLFDRHYAMRQPTAVGLSLPRAYSRDNYSSRWTPTQSWRRPRWTGMPLSRVFDAVAPEL